ncbi:MAG TPA: dihydroorotate dehydrogenase-like protein [Terriglobia bacterium]|nr:dihydroorotate dehydrogenase-like protein [Terriglobia bacterium]
MIDLKTTYLGLDLKNPLVASPSPLCEEISNIRQMEDAGAAAVVLHSLFEEQITLESSQLDDSLEAGAESFAESLSYFPDMTSYNLGPEGYLEHVRKAKAAVDIPVIASLNGVSTEGWIKYAKKIEEAGADALELNIYYLPTDPDMTAAEVEQVYYDLVAEVKTRLRIPLAVKIGPYFSSMGNAAQRLDESGADALVLFNRFYQPDFDLENLEVVPNLILSTPHELLLRLHWVAIIYGHIRADLALTGGVYTAADVLKSMMAGARVAMMTSALLRYGIPHLEMVRRDLVEWMEKHEYESIHQMQGSMAHKSVADPSAFGRANYMKMLSSYTPRAVSKK